MTLASKFQLRIERFALSALVVVSLALSAEASSSPSQKTKKWPWSKQANCSTLLDVESFALFSVDGPSLRSYESKELVARRGRGETVTEIKLKHLTAEGQEQLLLDMEQMVLEWRKPAPESGVSGLTLNETQDALEMIRNYAPKWLSTHYSIFYRADAALGAVTLAFLEEVTLRESKIRGLSWKMRMSKALEAVRLKNLRFLAVAMGKGLVRSAYGNVRTMLIMGTLLGLWNNYMSPVQGVLFNYAAQKGSQDLGGASTGLQNYLASLGKESQMLDEMKSLNSELKTYSFDKMKPEEAQKVWKDFERRFAILAIRYNQVLPAQQRDGRSIFETYVLTAPITYASTLSTLETQYTLHAQEVRNLKAAGAPQAEIAHHEKMMEVAARGIATTLASWKLMEFIRPEHARPEQSSDDRLSYQDGMNRFAEILDFDIYAKTFSKQLDEVLEQLQLGIRAEQLKFSR